VAQNRGILPNQTVHGFPFRHWQRGHFPSFCRAFSAVSSPHTLSPSRNSTCKWLFHRFGCTWWNAERLRWTAEFRRSSRSTRSPLLTKWAG